jgi:hypothetical protein
MHTCLHSLQPRGERRQERDMGGAKREAEGGDHAREKGRRKERGGRASVKEGR